MDSWFQYGIAGGVTGTFLLLLVWLVRLLAHRFIAYMERQEAFMLATVTVLERISERLGLGSAKNDDDITAVTRLKNMKGGKL